MTSEHYRARRWIVEGSCTRSKRPEAFPSGVGGYALYGEGPYVVTRDGRILLDWLGSLGATPLGYTHPRIMAAVNRQVSRGAVFSLPAALEAEVAEQLAEVIPGAEQFKFFKTGSEAVTAAVNIARSATGRDLLVVDRRSYHGWHDWYRVTADYHPGVPDLLKTLVVDWPESDDLGDLPEDTLDRVAAVVVEPPRFRKVRTEWFQRIHDVAHAHGALVIHDNMVWGGRHAMAGADEYFGLTPDISCFGKAFGAGHALAFTCGPEAIMQHGWIASGTFSGDAIGLAACEEMLHVYRDEAVIKTLWAAGRRAMSAVELAARRHGVEVEAVGYPPHFTLRFAEEHRLKMSVFCQRMASRGILWHPGVTNASAAMGSEELTHTEQAIDASVAEIANGYPLVGEMYQAGARVVP